MIVQNALGQLLEKKLSVNVTVLLHAGQCAGHNGSQNASAPLGMQGVLLRKPRGAGPPAWLHAFRMAGEQCQQLEKPSQMLCALLGKQQHGWAGQAGEGVSQADMSGGRCSQVGKGRVASGRFWKGKGERVVWRKRLVLHTWFCIKHLGFLAGESDIKKVLHQECFRHVFERLLPSGYG